MTIGQRIQDCFIIDLRAMAIFRIAIAFCIISDLISRFPYLILFQSESGILPSGSLGFTKYLPHHWNDSYSFQLALFAVTLVFALMFLVGWKTKFSTFISWFLLVSLHSKLWITLDGADDFLRAAMFWSIFLPLGEYWSIDSRKKKEVKTQYFSVAAVALILLFVFYYFSAGVAKLNDAWLGGAALEVVLRQEFWLRPVGSFLSQFPTLLKILTPLVVLFEIIGPFVLLIPQRFYKIRLLAIISFILFQIGLGICIELNMMPWIATAVLLVFLPTKIWSISVQKENVIIDNNLFKKIVLIPLIVYVFGGFFIQKMNIDLPLKTKAYTLGLLSTWNFYDSPPSEDYVYSINAQLDNGETIALSSSDERLKNMFENYRFKYYLETACYPNSIYSERCLSWIIDSWEDENYSVKVVSAQLNCRAKDILIENGKSYEYILAEVN